MALIDNVHLVCPVIMLYTDLSGIHSGVLIFGLVGESFSAADVLVRRCEHVGKVE